MAFFVVLAAAWVSGGLFLRRLRLGETIEGLILRLYVGLCLCAVVVVILGSMSLRVAQGVLYFVAAAGLGYELFVRSRSRAPSESPGKYPPLSRLEYACVGTIGCVVVLSLVSALAPVTSWDAAVAHLALPQDYARAGHITLLEGNEYSGYPHFVHSLFAYAFFESGETAVTLLNCMFGLLGCAAVFTLGRRVGNRLCGLIAAAIYATAPIYMDQVGAASLDLAFVGISVAALTCLMAWYEEENLSWLVLGAFLAGSSCGIRHTGYLVCALFGLGVLVAESPSRKEAVAWFSGMAFLGALPWLARSAILTGNPTHPFFSSVFSFNSVPAAEVATLGTHSSIKGTGLKDLIWFPWNIIMQPHWYDGWAKSPGGLVLFLGVPGLVVGGRRARWLGAYSIAGGLCFFYFQHSARYLLPFFAPMMVVAAMAACWLRRYFRYLPALLIVAFVYGLALDLAAVHFKLPVVLGLETREQYLERRVERYPAFRWANKHIANGSQPGAAVPHPGIVLTLDPRSYYFKGPTYQNIEALKLLRDMPFQEQLAWLKVRGITHLFFPKTYVDESHGLHNIGVRAILTAWVQQSGHFVPIKTFDLVRPRADGTERVEIYEVHYDK